VACRGSNPVLVGRTEQLAVLAEVLADARQDGHPTLLIGGEAGVGKSRLLAELAAMAPDARLLTAGCLQVGGEELPFTPFAAVLRGLVRELGADPVTAMLPGRGVPELARLVPEFGEPDEGGAPGMARTRLFEEMLTLLGRLAESGPVILLIEDAHWADESTRSLLAFLIGQQRELPGVLVMATFRSDELHRAHPLRPMLAELARTDWVRRIELPRLTRRETGQLASQILGRELDPALVTRLHARSEGNPLFAEELIRCADLDRELPESLRDLLLGTVQQLPDATQAVLRVASSGIEPYGHALLAVVAGLGEDALTAALRPAVTANVLIASGDGYSYRHALICEAVNGDLLPGEDERQHARYASAIDADPSLAGPGRAAIEAAHHWYWAGDAVRGLSGAWRAVAEVAQTVAHAERLALLGRVLRLWDQVPDAAERTGTDRSGVLEQAMLTAELAGDYQRGLAFADAALAELDPVAAPARVAYILCKRSVFKKFLGQPGGGDDLRAALALVPAEAPADTDGRSTAATATRAEILLEMAYFGVTDRDRAYAEEALALARQSGAVGVEVNALLTLAIGATAPAFQAAPGSEALTLIARAHATAARGGHFRAAVRAAALESYLLEAAGEHERSAEVARQGMREAEANGLSRALGTFLAINVAEPLFALGRWDESLELAERALELSPPTLYQSALRMRLTFVALARGQVEAAAEALSAARKALSDAPYQDQYHLTLAELTVRVRLAADGPAAGLDEAIGVTERYNLSRAVPPHGWPLAIALAHASVTALRAAAGDQAEALALAGRSVALLGRLQTSTGGLAADGPLQRAYRLTLQAQVATASLVQDRGATAWLVQDRGATASLVQDRGATADRPASDRTAADRAAAARAAWDEAAGAWEAVRQPYERAIALTFAAEAELASPPGWPGPDREAAGERLRAAALLAAQLDARPLADTITSLARRAGVALGDKTPPSSGRVGLTDREFEVLRLVAAGRSNRDIAADLFISAKTASVHVSNIMAKLGAANRTEAAAIANRHQLV
jgi:DNA-binding CsgD family transcriptional regulator/tetratricopeptide (TPR) repeat protein